ncbi:MAG: DUF362 domain-containing protein [Victivallales bacterium]
MEKQIKSATGISRRTFIRGGIAAGVILSLDPLKVFAQENNGGVDVWVITSTDKARMMQKCMEIIKANGGFGNAKKVALKVNAGWDRAPEIGANTHPELVDGFLKGCAEAGIKEVILPEFTCHPANKTFVTSGILAAAEKYKAEIIDLGKDKKSFEKVKLDKAGSLKEAEVSNYFLNPDIAVVNMPVAKHHGGAGLTMAMKNWMGAVKDRGYWHKNDLHQCIADIATLIKPQWTIIDATRTMMDSGPQGPGKELKTPNMIIISKDQVAADAYTAKTLFPESTAAKAKYIQKAGEMGAGIADLAKMKITKFEV